MPQSRHFGATLSWDAWEVLAERFRGTDFLVEPAKHSYIGEPIKETRMMIKDPSGNLIEIKTYRDPAAVLRISPTL